MSHLFESSDGSRRNLRIGLFVIILVTLPLYCIGFILWSVAPQNPGRLSGTQTATLPPLTRSVTSTPTLTLTALPLMSATSLSPLQPTPGQFLPPGGGVNLPPTSLPPPILPPTSTPPPVIIPTSTPAPSLTPIPLPTNTPIPQPTDTPIPQPTDTPIPQPTNTDLPVELPTSTTIPFFPTDTETPESFSAETLAEATEVVAADT